MTKNRRKREYKPEEIAELLKTKTQAEIAKYYDCSRQRINQVVKAFAQKYPHLYPQKELSEEELRTALEQYRSISDIVKATGVSRHRVLAGMAKYGLRRKYYADILTRDVLVDLFVTQGLSDKKISEMYDCSVNTVEQLRKQHGVVASMREPKSKMQLTEKEFSQLYFEKGLTLQQIADVVGVSVCTLIKAKASFGLPIGKKRHRAPGVPDEQIEVIKKDWRTKHP